MDLFATVAQIGSADATCGVDSVSLVPYLRSAAAAQQRDAIFAETLSAGGEWDVAARNSDYKLIVRDYGGSAPAYELYDMTADRWEEINSLADGINLAELVITLELLNSLGALVNVPDACP